jgi:hypothetical protein
MVLIFLPFLLMFFDFLSSNGFCKEHQQESQINQKPLEASTSKSINRKGK